MKINNLKLKDFRCHRDIMLKLDRVNVIIGRNGAGKTSIRDGIEYALTGINRLTDGRGAGAEIMINWEAEKAEIALDLEDIGTVTREIPNNLQIADWEGNKTAQEDALFEKLKVDRRTIRAILNTTNFILLDPNRKNFSSIWPDSDLIKRELLRPFSNGTRVKSMPQRISLIKLSPIISSSIRISIN